MKNIEEMAHDYLCAEIAHSGMNMINEHDAVRMAFLFAEAMQAEAEKRKDKSQHNVIQEGFHNCMFSNKTDTGVLFREWKPDWSQAPEGFDWWAVDEYGAFWYAREIEWDGNEWIYEKGLFNGRSPTESAPSFNYQGDWKDSLRKRP